MDEIQNFGLFLTTAVLLNLSPGPDSLYIIGRSLAQGRRAGMISAVGISTGGLVHTCLAALGLSAILLTSATAFQIVKWAGALYLLILGIRMFKSNANLHLRTDHQESSLRKIYIQGLLTNILNPKVALFFLALIPQFIAPDAPRKTITFILLGLTFVTTGTIWCLLLAYFASLIGKFIEKSKTLRRRMHQLAGSVFIFLGIRLALQQR